jgi:predicted DNA-binding protein with PD1-like motif
MIVTQSHKRRSFVGCLNAGTDLLEALRGVCVDNTILCGFFKATGYLKDAKLRTFDATTRSYGEAQSYPGTLHGVSMTGNISLVDRQTAIRCHIAGSLLSPGTSSPVAIAGELVAGQIVAFEFVLETIDDIRLYRERDERTGLDGWLHLEFAQAGNPIVRQAPPEAQLAITPQPPVVNKPAAPTESPVHDVREGDFLNHPTLGRCVVVSADQDDRLTIRLESGRNVELHTGLVDIAPPRTAADGTRTFAVSIRRRR